MNSSRDPETERRSETRSLMVWTCVFLLVIGALWGMWVFIPRIVSAVVTESLIREKREALREAEKRQTLLRDAPAPASLQRYTATEPHMGVEYEIVVFAADEPTATAGQRAAFDRIEALNKVLSDYDSSSETLQLCATAPHEKPVAVSADLRAMLVASRELFEQTDGAFDVTIGPLTKIWRRARRQRQLPADEALAEARRAVDGKAVELTADGVRLLKPEMRLDFGGIAKGHAAEEALLVLKSRGIKHALVRGSGDIAAGEAPPGELGWKIAIAPLDADALPTEYLTLANACISTSGDARQHLIVDGKRYSHILDPRTGRPIEGRSSVTVVAPHGGTADGLATALSVLGAEAGLAIIEKTPGTSAMMIVERDGMTTRSESNRFGPTKAIE